MTTTFAIWAGNNGLKRMFTIHPMGVNPRGAVAVSPYLPLGFAEAVATGCSRRWQGRTRSPSTRKMRRITTQYINNRFPQLGPTRQWRWPHLQSEESNDGADIGADFGADSGIKSGMDSGINSGIDYDSRPERRSRLRNTSEEFVDAVHRTLAGRQYTSQEISNAFVEEGILVENSIDLLLHRFVTGGLMKRVAGVAWAADAPRQWRCMRCYSNEIGFYPCYRCGLEWCPQCDTCMSIGRVTACTPLYRMGADHVREQHGSKRHPAVSMNLAFPLTPHQQRISKELANDGGDALVWAACGAGKTEVTYETIRRTLEAGGRVLFAVPRRDVVEQLGRRLSDVFSDVEVAALFGGTPQRYTQAPLVVATVHQTLRFHCAFDLVIIDEVDAFPLNREPWLLDGLERSLKPGGRCITMSATPSPAILKQTERVDWSLHVLPARHHGHPLPMPRIETTPAMRNHIGDGARGGNSRRDGKWTVVLGSLIEEGAPRGRKTIVFVPSVTMGTRVAEGLKSMFPRLKVTSVHAGDAKRSDKLSLMEKGAIDVLVSTTVLERGVTFPGLDVIVFAADTESVWDVASLIQMAGRVGRQTSDPTGRVVFLAGRSTPAMREACETIAELNDRARKLGLLKEDAH